MLNQATLAANGFSNPVVARAGTSVRTPASRALGEPRGVLLSFAANSQIFAQGDPSGNVYQVLSGLVRVSRLLADGRRQISGFYLPGEMFGLEADETHQFSAEAVVPSKVVSFKLASLLSLSDGNHELARELWQIALRSLTRAQSHLMLLGRRNALERVAAFLLELCERQGGGNTVELPMSRLDIADYLGLTLETVSRMFGELKDMGAIALASARRVEVLDHKALKELIA